MSGRSPIFHSALLLTAVHLLLRTIGTSFQVYLSGQIGAAGIGLLQLILSVGSFSMIAGMAGVRTATMYLCAEELGKKRFGSVPWVLSGCYVYSILCSSSIALTLYNLAPYVAEYWIRDVRTIEGLRLYAAFLPVVCLSGVMSGYFTAAGKIGTLAAVEVAEQLLSMSVTVFLLRSWAGNDSVRSCMSVILGSSLGACLTLLCLVILAGNELRLGKKVPNIRSRLLHTAVPLAGADVLKSGINTTESLMVPTRLALYPGVLEPLAAFGVVTGMVFPVIMFPACILFALAELLIPEMARCRAAGSQERILYLTGRSLKITLLYGLIFGGILWLCAGHLCIRLYDRSDAAASMKLYALLIPMLYCDTITDAMIKGLGQQKICVLYNILTSVMDVVFLYLLLPRYGMTGYFISFAITHMVNFILSFRRLIIITGYRIPAYVPLLAIAGALLAGILASTVSSPAGKILIYMICIGCILRLFGILGREDLHWVHRLVSGCRNNHPETVG